MALPIIIDDAVVERALAEDKVCARIMAKRLQPLPGQLVGVRLNLNIWKSRRVPVQTLHKGNGSGKHRQNAGFFNGSVMWYQKIVVVKDAYFNVGQTGREKIAAGTESKHPIASVDGMLVDTAAPSFEGIEVRFEPHATHLFYMDALLLQGIFNAVQTRKVAALYPALCAANGAGPDENR